MTALARPRRRARGPTRRFRRGAGFRRVRDRRSVARPLASRSRRLRGSRPPRRSPPEAFGARARRPRRRPSGVSRDAAAPTPTTRGAPRRRRARGGRPARGAAGATAGPRPLLRWSPRGAGSPAARGPRRVRSRSGPVSTMRAVARRLALCTTTVETSAEPTGRARSGESKRRVARGVEHRRRPRGRGSRCRRCARTGGVSRTSAESVESARTSASNWTRTKRSASLWRAGRGEERGPAGAAGTSRLSRKTVPSASGRQVAREALPPLRLRGRPTTPRRGRGRLGRAARGGARGRDATQYTALMGRGEGAEPLSNCVS